MSWGTGECSHSWDSYNLRFPPMWSNLKSSASTCAWSVTLKLSVFCRENNFQAPLWFILYLANPALNLPQEISNHFSPPFTAYVHNMPPRPSFIPTCCFSLCFRNSPLREWETGPWRRLGFTLRNVCPPHSSSNPMQVTYWSQCAALSRLRRRAFMVRWDSNECLWALSGCQRPGIIPAFTVTRWLELRYGVSLCDSESVISTSLHLFISWSQSLALKISARMFYVCFTKPRKYINTFNLCVRWWIYIAVL